MAKFQWKDMQGLVMVGQLGLLIIGPALAGLWVGLFISNYVGYRILLAICGMLLGLAGGSMQAYRLMMKKK